MRVGVLEGRSVFVRVGEGKALLVVVGALAGWQAARKSNPMTRGMNEKVLFLKARMMMVDSGSGLVCT